MENNNRSRRSTMTNRMNGSSSRGMSQTRNVGQSSSMEQNGMSQGSMQQENARQGSTASNGVAPPTNMTQSESMFKDYGPVPVIFDMETMTKRNNAFRTSIWTGKYLQVTVMSLQPGEDIGVEMHPDVDQFIRIEQGDGIVEIGTARDNLSFNQPITDDDAIIIPAGSWHNISNTGDIVMKAFSVYAPPNHPFGTKQQTRADKDA